MTVNGAAAIALVVLLVTMAAILAPRIVRGVLRQSLPQTEGSLVVDGVEAPLEIIRDVDGVPHIYAANPPDAYFGLGFVHAQDRLWQMECQRRLAAGRLSEIFGPRSVAADRLLRTFGLRRAAESALGSLPADARAAVDAYTRGINACLARHRGLALPPEFLLLRVRPEPWQPVDVLACAKLMAWQLNFTYAAELLYADLIERVGRDRASMLLTFADEPPPPAAARRPETPRRQPVDDEAGDSAAIAGGREGFGSNAWVVDGTRSATRGAVLANDPHLPSGAPSSWYVAHLCAGSLDAIGAGLPGIPGIVAGRNRHIAWGTANLSADVQDLFRERLSSDGRHVQCGDRMEPMTCIDEVIHVRGRRKPVSMTVRVTPRGPLISDALNANRARTRTPAPTADREPLSLRWTAIDGADTTLAAMLALNEARDWNGFRDRLRQYVAPPVAFSYADADGHIGLQMAGRIPVRASGDGSIPGDGWTGASDWVGFVPFDDLPAMHDPDAGLVVAANAEIAPADSACFLGRALVEPYRQRRIAELLTARPRLEVQDHLAIQGDTVSVHARALLPDLLRFVTPETPREADALSLLRAWDFDMHAQSVAAAIFAAWWLRLPHALVEHEIGPVLYRAFEGWVSCMDRFVRNTLRDAHATEDAGGRARCARVVRESFERALTDLEQRLGPDLRAWHWGRVHRAVFPHTPLHQVRWLRRWFSRSVATGGDWSTISVGGTWTLARPFEQRYVAGYRQVIDLSALDGGRFIYPMGQSGHVLSRHYDDYLADWAACRTRPMRLERSTVERAQRSVLWLRPRPATGRAPRGQDITP